MTMTRMDCGPRFLTWICYTPSDIRPHTSLILVISCLDLTCSQVLLGVTLLHVHTRMGWHCIHRSHRGSQMCPYLFRSLYTLFYCTPKSTYLKLIRESFLHRMLTYPITTLRCGALCCAVLLLLRINSSSTDCSRSSCVSDY